MSPTATQVLSVANTVLEHTVIQPVNIKPQATAAMFVNKY